MIEDRWIRHAGDFALGKCVFIGLVRTIINEIIKLMLSKDMMDVSISSASSHKQNVVAIMVGNLLTVIDVQLYYGDGWIVAVGLKIFAPPANKKDEETVREVISMIENICSQYGLSKIK